MKKIMHRQIRVVKNWVVSLDDPISFLGVLAEVSAAQYNLNNVDGSDGEL